MINKLVPNLILATTGAVMLSNIAFAGLPSYLKNDDPDRVAYGIQTKTWNATENPPYVQLKGTKGSQKLDCKKIRLDNKPANFKKGQTDYFVFTGQDIGDCGFPTSITFTANGDDGWGVEGVFVDYLIIPERRWHWMNNGPEWFGQFKDYNNRNNILNLIKKDKTFYREMLVSKKPIKMQGKEGVDGNGGSSGGKKFTKSKTFKAVGAHPPGFTVEKGDFIAVPGTWRAIINSGGTAVSESEQKLIMSEKAYKEVSGGGSKALEETLGMSTTVSAEADIGGVKASASTTVSSSLKGTISNYFSNTKSTANERNNSNTNKLTCNVPKQPPEYTIWAWTNQAKVMGEMVSNNTCLYACTKSSTIPPKFRLGQKENTCPGVKL